MYKFSLYNFFVKNGSSVLLFNIGNDQILALLPDMAQILKENQDNIDAVAQKNKDLFEALLQRSMIVDENVDEAEVVSKVWNAMETCSDSYAITVLPTLQCNLRCWYCYEKHDGMPMMKVDVLENIKKHIDSVVTSPQLKQLHIDFFGGEPLLGFDAVVIPLLQYARKKTQEYGKILTTHFTTNGVLLNEERINRLMEIQLDGIPDFQITLDGACASHDKVRCLRNGTGTFKIIVENIHELLKAGFHVSVRINYTLRNIDTLIDVMEAFEILGKENRQHLTFDFHRVWQDVKGSRVDIQIEKIRNEFNEEGFQVVMPSSFSRSRCYADHENKVVVNYNGDIFKCTARDFSSVKRDGVLLSDGSIMWNEQYKRRMQIKHGFSICKSCRVYPLCGGLCSQRKLEAKNKDICIAHRCEEDKEAMIIGRLKYLIKNEGFSHCV